MRNAMFYSLLTLFVMAGCRTSQPVVYKYYLLEFNAGQMLEWPERIAGIPASCEITTVQIAPAYSGSRIAVREASHQIRYFTFNEWAIRPEQGLTRIALDYLDAHRVFDTVKHGRPVVPADYLLDTHVYHIELDARGEVFRARLHVEFQLTDAAGTVIGTYSSDEYRTLPEKNVNGFAEAVSELFVDALHTFSVKIMQDLAR